MSCVSECSHLLKLREMRKSAQCLLSCRLPKVREMGRSTRRSLFRRLPNLREMCKKAVLINSPLHKDVLGDGHLLEPLDLLITELSTSPLLPSLLTSSGNQLSSIYLAYIKLALSPFSLALRWAERRKAVEKPSSS